MICWEPGTTEDATRLDPEMHLKGRSGLCPTEYCVAPRFGRVVISDNSEVPRYNAACCQEYRASRPSAKGRQKGKIMPKYSGHKDQVKGMISGTKIAVS
jgi:hypothetical protein